MRSTFFHVCGVMWDMSTWIKKSWILETENHAAMVYQSKENHLKNKINCGWDVSVLKKYNWSRKAIPSIWFIKLQHQQNYYQQSTKLLFVHTSTGGDISLAKSIHFRLVNC